MKASMFLAATGAALAVASPIRVPLDKRAMETDWVVEVVTVTVTAGQEPAGVFYEVPTSTTSVEVVEPTVVPQEKTQSLPKKKPQPEAPAPVITTVVVPQPSAEPQPEPEPQPETTTAAPEPAPEPETTTAEPEPTTAPAPEEPSTDSYEGVMLKQHNVHRSNHSAPALSWDSTLAGYAKTIAEGCVFAHDMNQGSGGYGQNLASWGTTDSMDGLKNKMAASAVTEQWYNGEVNAWTFYGMDNPPSNSPLTAWGHFTQVVWKSTTKVGCYTASCPAGTVLQYPSLYTVCNYDPPGNYGGEYADNVLKPLGMATTNV
ncbi:CAP domain-containing protein [Emericellopsis atlantica]|uniref:CAP domain-containing protein n=1 Tax=Emericellopsis atlantica TaxID=2614577 RepID=A0A9P7ZWH6_9HYPO|nr:CAP domain-containing protein [Emericellopsis atlantica]KAG9259012.1 CAP domain-containing protein [Emericellopsis atlantica]